MLKFLVGKQVIKYAKELQITGAKNVLVSRGGNGAILLDENGCIYTMNISKKEKVLNTVGAGDSMVAGFIAGYQKFNNYKKALEMGMAAGTATATSTFLASKEEILHFFEILSKS